MINNVDVSEARALAHRLLADELPQRWLHVQGVAKRAELFVDLVPNWDALTCAAYLHDIGYSSPAHDIGFHQIDGARHLRRLGWDEAVVNLVAHHSRAQARAELSGLGHVYRDEFVRDETLPHLQLHFCDITVSLDGAPTTVHERLTNMRRRHRGNPTMIQFLDAHESEMRTMVKSTWSALGRSSEDREHHKLSVT